MKTVCQREFYLKKGFFFIITLLVLVVFLGCNVKRHIEITKEEGRYIILSGNDRLVAEPVKSKKTEKFLVVGGSGRGLNPFIAHLSVMPFAQLERVLNSCGGLDVCRRDGALERSGWISSMFLYADSLKAITYLERIDNLAMSWEYPLIELTYQEIRVIKHTRRILTEYTDIDSRDFQPNFIATDVRILQRNYQSGQ